MTSQYKFSLQGAFLVALLSGCAFGPRKPFTPQSPTPSDATVYFYRPSEMTGRLIRPTITANGAKVGRLANDAYGFARLSPGTIQLRSTWPGIPGTVRDDSVTLNVEAGKSYYVRVRYHVTKAHNVTPAFGRLGALSFENRVGLEEVPEAQAVPQLAGLALSDSFGP